MIPVTNVTELAAYLASRWDLDSLLDELAIAGRRLMQQAPYDGLAVGGGWRVFTTDGKGNKTIESIDAHLYPGSRSAFDERAMCAMAFIAQHLTSERYLFANPLWRRDIGMQDDCVIYIGAGPALEAWLADDTTRHVKTSSTRRDDTAVRKVRRRYPTPEE